MRKSAENGDKDAGTAFETYRKASETLRCAEAGDAHSQAEISKLYIQLGGSLEQFGPQNDYQEAFKWAKFAASQNDPDGMYNLALCYEHGRGTPANQEMAITFYEKAAKMGHAPSQWNLAVCYINGSGRDRNDPQGYIWAYTAANQGYELAINGLKTLHKSVGQIIESYKSPDMLVYLDGTQYEGRASRCEKITAGMELSYEITRDKNGDDVIELFYNGETVGVISKYYSAHLIALLKLDMISLKVIVKDCIPKSQRGPRARNADVKLSLFISEKHSETDEGTKQLISDSIDMSSQRTKDRANSSVEMATGDVECSECEQEPSISALTFTFENGLKTK